jgi:hypothetical protein
MSFWFLVPLAYTIFLIKKGIKQFSFIQYTYIRKPDCPAFEWPSLGRFISGFQMVKSAILFRKPDRSFFNF